MELKLNKNQKEIENYWRRVIEQRKEIVEEAARAASKPKTVKPPIKPTAADQDDIRAIQGYLNREKN